MTLALENCADQLTLFEKSADRMTDVLLNTVGEMKICGIEPDMLTKTAEAVTEDSLSRKLKEIALDVYKRQFLMILPLAVTQTSHGSSFKMRRAAAAA